MRDEAERRLPRSEDMSRRAEREAIASAALGTGGGMKTISAPAETPTPPVSSSALGWVVAAFLAGILIGGAVLLGYAWVAVG
jgi:hypothetical protein